jgi:hypothetical protein
MPSALNDKQKLDLAEKALTQAITLAMVLGKHPSAPDWDKQECDGQLDWIVGVYRRLFGHLVADG